MNLDEDFCSPLKLRAKWVSRGSINEGDERSNFGLLHLSSTSFVNCFIDGNVGQVHR